MDSDKKLFTMMHVCRELGLTYQTLKFYCNQGLVPNVKRDKNNRRIFDGRDIEWLRGLGHLKRCGMSIEEMKAYMNLCLEGPRSIPERKLMLDAKRKALVEKLAEVQKSIDYIDRKQAYYDDVLAGRVEYASNLPPKDESGGVRSN